MFRKTLKTAGVLLVLFHAGLFASQLWEGDLADLALLGRWAVAGGLAWALVALRRQGAPLLPGRRAAAIWVLAALLHGPALAARTADFDVPALPDIVVSLTQAAAGVAIVSLVLLSGFLNSKHRHGSPQSARLQFLSARPGPLAPGSHVVFAPRPPPAA